MTSADNTDLVDIRGVHFSRDDRVIFDNIDIRIQRGKITAIMGPSGTGKTTLLRLIAAQVTPDQGSVIVDGQPIHQSSIKQLYAARRKMGMLFQNAALFTNLNVF